MRTSKATERPRKYFQESLLLSIIPKHIASQVGEEVSNFLSNLTNDGVTERFSETFIETHKNVSILYADICGFTPLTEKFTKKIINGKEVPIDRIEDLVATLNDLFAKFDEAADVSSEFELYREIRIMF